MAPHIPVFDKSKRDDGTFSRGDFDGHRVASELRKERQGDPLRQGWTCDNPGSVEIGRSLLESRAAAAIAGSGVRIASPVVSHLDTRIKRPAAPVHRSKRPPDHLRPVQRVTVPKVAVPGWTDEETRYWLDQATGPKD